MITIVTAFFDIGRGDWAAFPRSVDTYFRNFERLCLLDNPLVLFTESRHQARLAPLQARKPNLRIVYDDGLFERHTGLLEQIAGIQASAAFREGITDPSCPEYNEPRYVLINYLKSQFCVRAIEDLGLSSQTVAWIDFGYLRKNRQLPVSLRWDFDVGGKIHLFNLLPVQADIDIVKAIKQNTVYIQGCHIVAPADRWPLMAGLMEGALQRLLAQGLIDDDQTLLLMASLQAPEQFVLHAAEVGDKLGWFFIFRKYNRFEQRLSLGERFRFLLARIRRA